MARAVHEKRCEGKGCCRAGRGWPTRRGVYSATELENTDLDFSVLLIALLYLTYLGIFCMDFTIKETGRDLTHESLSNVKF